MVKRKITAEIILMFPNEEEETFSDEKCLEAEMQLNAFGDTGLGTLCMARFHFKLSSHIEDEKIE